MVHAIRSDSQKYQKSDDTVSLYSLPDEGLDVEDRYPAVAERQDDDLERHLAAIDVGGDRGADATFSDAIERQLGDLGYL